MTRETSRVTRHTFDEMTASEKVRDALWRYAPERTEKMATVAVVAGAVVLGVANWLRKGRP